jgi:hypothetical protein
VRQPEADATELAPKAVGEKVLQEEKCLEGFVVFKRLAWVELLSGGFGLK